MKKLWKNVCEEIKNITWKDVRMMVSISYLAACGGIMMIMAGQILFVSPIPAIVIWVMGTTAIYTVLKDVG